MAASIVFASTASAQGEEPEVRTVARLVVTSGVGGHLARAVCDGETDFAPSAFSHVTPHLLRETQGGDRPLLLDTGGLLSPGGVGRFAAEHDATGLAELLTSLGYRALVFGSADLGAPRAPMIAALGALRALRVPVVASNLRCRGSARSLCEVLVDEREGAPMLRVGARRVALLSFLPPSSLAAVAPDLAEGITITPAAEAMPRAVARARDRGATLVIAVVDEGGDLGRAFALASELPEDRRPDVLVLADAGDQVGFARPRGFTPAIVAAPPGGATTVRVRESALLPSYELLARPLSPSAAIADVHRVWTERVGERYCSVWGRELAGGAVSERLTGEGLLTLSAGVVRALADADVAVLNRAVLADGWQPSRPDALTASDVFVAIEYDDPVVVADVPASWLTDVVARRETHALLVLGASEDGTEINDRPLQPGGTYRVATLRFLASGGDEALPDGPRWEPVGAATLRSAVLRFLEEPRDVDPRDAVDDPAERLEWTIVWNADGSFAGSRVRNPVDASGAASYSAAQLSRVDELTLGLSSVLRADAVARRWGWENEGIARFRATSTGAASLAESDDLLSVRTTVSYRGLLADHDHFAVPSPYVEGYLESELTRPDGRGYHHLLLRPTAGLRFSLTSHLSLKLGGGVQRELLDDAAAFEPGAVVQLVLRPWEVLSDGGRTLTVQLSTDYFVAGGTQELRAGVESALDLAGPFALVFGFQAFAQKDRGARVGYALDATAALRVRWSMRTL